MLFFMSGSPTAWLYNSPIVVFAASRAEKINNLPTSGNPRLVSVTGIGGGPYLTVQASPDREMAPFRSSRRPATLVPERP